MNIATNKMETIIRHGARLLSALILLFWGFFLLAHLFGNAGSGTRPLVWQDYLMLTTLCTALAGLALAWKHERTGGIIALLAITVCATVNWRVLVFPGTLIPLNAALFLCAAWMRRHVHSTRAA